MNFVYRGRCFKFGDNIHADGDCCPLALAVARETRPEVLREVAMTGLDPDFPKKVKPGDLVVAGRNFGSGHAHIQGVLAIAACKVGLVVESTPYANLRNIVNAGLPTLTGAKGATALCETGDELEVDFSTGRFRNLTTGRSAEFTPLAAALRDTIALGGWKPMVARRIAAMNEPATSARLTPR
jgi:3-isopropylmalate/(R)-2-methylmalate dehydratase small subunit